MIINKVQEFYAHLFLIGNLQSLRNFTKKIISLKTFNSFFSYIEVWFTDQNIKPLKIENRINLTLVIK